MSEGGLASPFRLIPGTAPRTPGAVQSFRPHAYDVPANQPGSRRSAYPAGDATVVGLACGAGSRPRLFCRCCGMPNSPSPSMPRSHARRRPSVIHDRRVRLAALASRNLDEGGVVAWTPVVCDSAIWQTDVQATAAAVRRCCALGGRFVFNLAAAMLASCSCRSARPADGRDEDDRGPRLRLDSSSPRQSR